MTAPAPAITSEATHTTRKLSAVVLVKIATYPFVILAATLVPRMMGSETYGDYALLVSIIAIATSLLDLGVESICGRFVPEFETHRDEDGLKRLFSNLLLLKMLIDVFAAAALLLVLQAMYADRFSVSHLLVILAIVIVVDSGMVAYSVLFGLDQLGKCALADLIKRSLGLGLVLGLFLLFGLMGALVGILAVEAITTIAMFLWTKGHLHVDRVAIDLSFLRPYLQFGFIFYLSYGLSILLARLGNPLIEYFSGDARQIAFFDIPNQIFLITVTFTSFLLPWLIPMLSKLLLLGKEDKLIRWSELLMKYTGVLCAAAFLGFVFGGPDLISFVIGSEYRPAFSNAVILLVGIFPATIVQFGFVFSIVYKEPVKYLVALIAALTTFVVASVVLIPRYASVGCAIATLVSYCVLAAVIYVHFKQKLDPCLPGLMKVSLLGLIFLPLAYFRSELSVNLVLATGVLAAYVALLFASGALRREEVRAVLGALRRRPEEAVRG